MDLKENNYTLILATFAIIILLIYYYYLSFFYKTTRPPPEASGAWPIIGHFKVFNGSDLPHVAFSSMADRYGPIFTVRLGLRKVLVVSNWEIAKEIFTTHDVNVSDRPNYIAAKILGRYGASFSFTPYGPYWRGMRKLISQELLSNSQLEKLKHVRMIELESAIKNMHELWKEKRNGEGKVLVEMKKWFVELNMNTMLKIVTGKRYTGGVEGEDEEEEMMKFREVLRERLKYLGQFLMGDAIPFLRWLDWGGYEKTIKRVVKDLDSMVGKWLQEHRRKRSSGEINDFMDMMIRLVEDDGLARNYDADTIIKATCEILIAGGADTTTVMLTWTLALLLNNPDALRKAQEELDTQVGKNRQVNESDIKNLIYLQAILKETLRLYPSEFINAPRVFTKDCTIAGYHVPKGTWLLINTWKLHRDPNIWSDPCEFRPERFLSPNHKDLDVKRMDFEFIPFGVGRRRCPGIGLAVQILHMVLATLLHNFDISTPNGSPVNMGATGGVTNERAGPFEVLVSPRTYTQQ